MAPTLTNAIYLEIKNLTINISISKNIFIEKVTY